MVNFQSAELPESGIHRSIKRMPIYRCDCGVEILVLPDLVAMTTAIKNHVSEHNRLGGQTLTEDGLTQEIIKVVLQTINKKTITT